MPTAGALTLEQIRAAPKVLLHDHLDGGLRPETVIELADQTGYQNLPSTDRLAFPRRLDASDAGGR